jgi:hypothetical protein
LFQLPVMALVAQAAEQDRERIHTSLLIALESTIAPHSSMTATHYGRGGPGSQVAPLCYQAKRGAISEPEITRRRVMASAGPPHTLASI